MFNDYQLELKEFFKETILVDISLILMVANN